MSMDIKDPNGFRKEKTGLDEYAADLAADLPAYSREPGPSTSSSVVVASPFGNGLLPTAALTPNVPTNGVRITTVLEPIRGSWLLDPLAAQTSVPSIFQTIVEHRVGGRRQRRFRNATMGAPTAKFDSRHGNISASLRVVGESPMPATATIQSATHGGNIVLELVSKSPMRMVHFDAYSRTGLLSGSRWQRGSHHAPPQGESASHASQEPSLEKSLPGEFPEYVRIASSCDFGSARRESGLPPAYSWATSERDPNPDVMRTVEDTLRELEPELRRLSLDIHGHPELNFEERYAHDRLTEFMSSRGFTVTRHYLGLSTAWCAEFRRGTRGRIVGVNVEMDALPGIGHACGHNLIAMAGVGVALALRAALEEHDVPGTVLLLGTPAEESGAGKQILLDKGAYETMDLQCVRCHPVAGDTLELGFVSSLALQSLTVEYFGQPAHAGYSPWDGVNTLDAAFVAYAGISALRQQIRPEQRVHGVISGRDWTPNVIPDYAKMSWSVRADVWDAVEPLRERVVHCFEAGATATGCRHEIALGERYLDLRQNSVLADDMALTAQRCYGIPSYWTPQPAPASTDFGNVSHAIPTPDNAKNHTPGFARGARTEAAHAAALRTAALLARTGFRVFADGAFYARVRAAYDLDAGGGGGSSGAGTSTSTNNSSSIARGAGAGGGVGVGASAVGAGGDVKAAARSHGRGTSLFF
ncbi:hypothetical protein BC827DRAFT_1264286 [Russula dissimulans]|nr:hypothetical protein BC827DRAFT_1264286 [Russula dissimulans]